MPRRVALIGSFKQHYADVLRAIDVFRRKGVEVASPLGDPIVKPGIPFVRFTSDRTELSDASVQTVTLQRIFTAELTYVVAPGGYVGKTTSYEIGRLLQARRPVYFSEAPADLPIELPSSHVVKVDELAAHLNERNWLPSWPFQDGGGHTMEMERALFSSS